jgi:hypothetical protein
VTAFILERVPVTTGLLSMLRTFTGNKGEVGEAPRDIVLNEDGQLIDPYFVVYPIPSLNVWGDMAHPEAGARLSYQITSVGRTDESAGIMADRVRLGILERANSGSFARAIATGVSVTVIDRALREMGFLTPEAGRWTIYDTFDLEVQAHA